LEFGDDAKDAASVGAAKVKPIIEGSFPARMVGLMERLCQFLLGR
jgi:hypothetical protein